MNPVKQSLNNIRIIQKSVAETPIHEITREVQKVSRLFFSQVESNFSSFDIYIRDFHRLVEIIRVISENCLILDQQISLSDESPSGKGTGLDVRLLREVVAEVMDRVFELNVLNDDLGKYHRELSRFLKRFRQFYKKETKARNYVRVIKQEKKVRNTLKLFRLTVTTGLKSLKVGIHPESLLNKELGKEKQKKLLENSQYNYRRVTHSVVRYFQAVCTILAPNVRPVVLRAREVLHKLDKHTTRDDSYRFILDVINLYHPGMKRLVKNELSDSLVPEFRISHDNLRVIGLGKLDLPEYQEEEWIGKEEEQEIPVTIAEQKEQLWKIKVKITELNRLMAKGRLGIKTLEGAKKKILYQNFLLSMDYVAIIKRLCKSLMEPVDYYALINGLYSMKPHTVETPDVLRVLGDLSNQVSQNVTALNKKKALLALEVTDTGYQHRIRNKIYQNTAPTKLETFTLVFSHFYYTVRIGAEKF